MSDLSKSFDMLSGRAEGSPMPKGRGTRDRKEGKNNYQ